MRRGDVVTLCGDDPLLAQRVEVLAVLPDAKVEVRVGGGAALKVDRSLLSAPGNSSPRHRATDPETSRTAAARVKPGTGRYKVLAALVRAGRRGLTDFEYGDTGLKQTSAGVRRGELEKMGLCEPTGLKRPSDTQSDSEVHRITDKGLRVWLAAQDRAAS